MILASGTWPVAVFAVLVLLAGGALAAIAARGLLRVWRARAWVVTPCEVRAIRAVGVEDYSVEITFTYVVGGTAYQSDRYCLANDVSLEDAHAVVARHPPGSAAVCYVNPAAPADAVFVRTVNVVPTALLLVLGGVVAALGVHLGWLWATGRDLGR